MRERKCLRESRGKEYEFQILCTITSTTHLSSFLSFSCFFFFTQNVGEKVYGSVDETRIRSGGRRASFGVFAMSVRESLLLAAKTWFVPSCLQMTERRL